MLLPIPPNSTGPFGVQLRNSPCPAPRTNPGLAIKPDFLEISIRSLCDKSPFEAMCWLEADLVPDPEFCSANLPWTQFPGTRGPSQELELGPNLLALGPAFLILTPVLPITDSFFFLCPALLQTGNRMNMTKWVELFELRAYVTLILGCCIIMNCLGQNLRQGLFLSGLAGKLAWPSPLSAQPSSYYPNTGPANPVLRRAKCSPHS